MEPQPIVFLDFDGVLNSSNYFVAGRKRKLERIKAGLFQKGEDLDTEAIANVNTIIKATGAKVVVTSTWRKSRTVEELATILQAQGLMGEVIDKTEDLSYYKCLRGNEILEWIKNHTNIVGEYYKYTNYVILDDDSDMLYWQKDNYLKINGITGLTSADSKKAIEIINKPTNPEALYGFTI